MDSDQQKKSGASSRGAAAIKTALPKTKVPLPATFGAFDGRERECLAYVQSDPRTKHNPAAVVAAIDEFAYKNKWLMNVGDVKGKILDECLERAQPRTLLELGAYIGYSSLRMIQRLPKDARIVSVEFSGKIAAVAREMIAHAGISDRIAVVHGHMQDQDQRTKQALERDYGFGKQMLDFVFLDHAKEAYLPDIQLILASGWLHQGSIAFADNVLYPGAPEYRKFMQEQEGKLFRTKETDTWLEYQDKVPDLVLESVYIGQGSARL